MQVFLANPRGFCAGVVRAIDIVESALQIYGPPIYVFHEIVHNKFVLTGLKARGVVFVDSLSEVPQRAVTIFSAHGVAKTMHAEAQQRNLRVLDATCPLVTKVHHQVERLYNNDHEVVVIGHAGHPEIIGTMGQLPAAQNERVHLVNSVSEVAQLAIHHPERVGYVTQTTLAVDETQQIIQALQQRYPKIVAPSSDDICYATQNRQEAVKQLVRVCEVILVVGSKNSSNSNSLKNLAVKYDVPAYLIDGPEDLQRDWLANRERVGVTAGASAPDELINLVITRLREWGASDVRELQGVSENVHFQSPKILEAV